MSAPQAGTVAGFASGGVVSYVELAALPSAPSRARQQARAVLGSWQIGAEIIETAELLVSELVTNAVTFGSPGNAGAGLLSLVLRHFAGRVIIEVADHDSRPPAVREADGDAESGRGLILVDALSEEWGHYLPPSGGKIVYCVLEAV